MSEVVDRAVAAGLDPGLEPGFNAGQWRSLPRVRGMRATTARLLILQALGVLEYGTAEQIYTYVKPRFPGLTVSTVYRQLDSLREHDLITHAHLDRPTPSYLLSSDAGSGHLVCRDCHTVTRLDPDTTTALSARLHTLHGFDLDAGHLAITGPGAACSHSQTSTRRHSG